MAKKILISCPPMLGILDQLGEELERHGFEAQVPDLVQTLSVDELERLLPDVDGWIIGDDPAERRALEAGRRGRLRAMVKWGVGVDNVDFEAARALDLPVTHTPGMFGEEVADIAMGYVIALARETFAIDRGVRGGGWPKPRGMSLLGKTAAVVGFGDIGQAVARRLLASKVEVVAYDPKLEPGEVPEPFAGRVDTAAWPDRLEEAHFLVLCCALTPENHHLVDSDLLHRLRPGARLINVARGPLVDEVALEAALRAGRVYSAALDVFETEPLPADSPLRRFEQVIFGSHNASNTEEAVHKTSLLALELLADFLQTAP